MDVRQDSTSSSEFSEVLRRREVTRLDGGRSAKPMGDMHRPKHVESPSKEASEEPGTLRRPRLISIVVPVYNEGGNVDVLHTAISESMREWDYELVFVDDGSEDDTFRRVESLAKLDPRVRGVSFSRNFGHQQALTAGLAFAKGDVVVTMDGDMQHPPALLPQLIGQWRKGASIVYTKRRDSEGAPRLKRSASALFYKCFSLLCGVPLSAGMADFRLLDRKVVDEITRLRLNQVFLRGMIPWMGFGSAVVEYVPQRRHSGKTKYSLRKMTRLAADGILSFSTIPFMIALWAAVATSLLSIAELVYILVVWAMGRTVPGWASVTGILTLLFSVMFFVLAVQGQYIYRLYDQVHRPPYVIDRIIP
ncbi:MAG: glycosyltransferase family 2 protein [Sedimentisphaerales bacterium]|nr:glycosyltransferase family 2 protein [Sedimentisphaerales bacterium]